MKVFSNFLFIYMMGHYKPNGFN